MYEGETVAEFLKENITDEELETNTLKKKIKIQDKVFNVGTKITKILTAVADYYQDLELKNKIVGNLRPQKQKSGIILSSHPTAFVAGGYFGESCLSPDGDNQEGALVAIGYPNTLIAHTEDFSWRAWVVLDRDNKKFSIFKGYPRENYYAQSVVYMYLIHSGYTLSEANHFYFRGYMDESRVWPEVEDSTDTNVHSDYYWGESFIEDGISSETIIQFDRCQNCDKKFLNTYLDDGYCSYCEDDRSYEECEVCGETLDQDDMHYSERTRSFFCDHCFKEHKVEHAEYAKKLLLGTASYIESNFKTYNLPEEINLENFYNFVKTNYDESVILRDIGHRIEFDRVIDSYNSNLLISRFVNYNCDYRGRYSIFNLVTDGVMSAIDYINEF
jgi:hypothetical protein